MASALYVITADALLTRMGWPVDVNIVAAQVDFATGNIQFKIQHSSIPKAAVTVDAINKITTNTQVVFDHFVQLT